jgi:hypothetical protein
MSDDDAAGWLPWASQPWPRKSPGDYWEIRNLAGQTELVDVARLGPPLCDRRLVSDSDPERCDLRLMSSVSDPGDIPTEGENLVIVAAVNRVLHVRIFDGEGKVVVDTDETRLTGQARPIEDLKKQLESLWPPHQLTRSEKEQVIAAVTPIVGHTHWDFESDSADGAYREEYLYPYHADPAAKPRYILVPLVLPDPEQEPRPSQVPEPRSSESPPVSSSAHRSREPLRAAGRELSPTQAAARYFRNQYPLPDGLTLLPSADSAPDPKPRAESQSEAARPRRSRPGDSAIKIIAALQSMAAKGEWDLSESEIITGPACPERPTTASQQRTRASARR